MMQLVIYSFYKTERYFSIEKVYLRDMLNSESLIHFVITGFYACDFIK